MSVKIFLYIITSLILIGILKPVNSNISRILTLVISVIIAITSVNYIVPAIELIKKLSESSGFNNKYLEILLKCTAVCFLGNFTSNLCRDNGENTLVFSTEFVCKCTVIILSLPIYTDVFDWMTKLWQNI